jgi:protein-tyrosine phosphatase
MANDYGLDLAGHRSCRLVPEMVRQADLVVGMAREHVREATVMEPAGWPRTFSLKELIRRAGRLEPRTARQPLASWLAAAGQDREVNQLMGDDPADDVADPIGLSMETYRTTAAELDALLRRLVDAAFSPTPLTQVAR